MSLVACVDKKMLAYIFVILLFSLNTICGFDAGLLELRPLRQKDGDTTHYAITVCALCNVTIQYMKSVSKIDTTFLESKFIERNGQCEGNIVNDIVKVLTTSQGVNPWQFATMVKTIASSNTKTDLKEVFKTESHFDGETFIGGSQLVLTRYHATVDSILKADNYDQARKTFGEMLHTLQVSLDFFSPLVSLFICVYRISIVIQILLNLITHHQVMFLDNDFSEILNMHRSRKEHVLVVKVKIVKQNQIWMKIFKKRNYLPVVIL
jgi:hypothetical protein